MSRTRDMTKNILGKYNKEVYQKCQYCHQVIKIKKGFKKMPLFSICVLNFYKMWIKLIHKYTLYGQKTENLWILVEKNYVNRIFRYENIKDKYGEISQETIDIHLNSST